MQYFKENATLELKERLTDSFLKTVSAYANYKDGVIVFGVKDDGVILGVVDSKKMCAQIENKINDSIDPRPRFKLEIHTLLEGEIIKLFVYKGPHAPYLYRGVSYKRSDTSAVPLDAASLRDLSRDSSNVDFDQYPSSEANLTFKVLEKELHREIGLKKLDDDVLKTLALLKDRQYTIAGELFADHNNNLQSSTHVIRFGENISVLFERKEFNNQSILLQYNGAMEMFHKWYQPYEVIERDRRITRIQIPEEAFREALANALVHRRYDMNAPVQVAMFEKYIEIKSPGGLPKGMSETSYLYGRQSLLRNISIASIFHRLNIIEKFGTGIERIRFEYNPYPNKPEFKVEENHLVIHLPVIQYDAIEKELPLNERILLFISKKGSVGRLELEKATGYSKTRIYESLVELRKQNKIRVIGKGKSSKYELA